MASAFIVSIQQTTRPIATRASLACSNTALRSAAGVSLAWRNNVFRTYTNSSAVQKRAWDPSLEQYKYWNREESKKGEGENYSVVQVSTYNRRFHLQNIIVLSLASYVLDMSPESIQKEARILCLAAEDDEANAPLTQGSLPFGSKLLSTGITPESFDTSSIKEQNPNVLFVSPSCPHARNQLPKVLDLFPTIEWIHVRSAGIDFLESPDLPIALNARPDLVMTNAKGQFSSSLAEYVMMACSYFAKDIPRLLRQKREKVWNSFDIMELRGKTMGIVGTCKCNAMKSIMS
jgi:hypothetical protein